jgi:hypothetical protein
MPNCASHPRFRGEHWHLLTNAHIISSRLPQVYNNFPLAYSRCGLFQKPSKKNLGPHYSVRPVHSDFSFSCADNIYGCVAYLYALSRSALSAEASKSVEEKVTKKHLPVVRLYDGAHKLPLKSILLAFMPRCWMNANSLKPVLPTWAVPTKPTTSKHDHFPSYLSQFRYPVLQESHTRIISLVFVPSSRNMNNGISYELR